MRLLRFGPPSYEKPAFIGGSGGARDLSVLVTDIDGALIGANIWEQLARLDLSSLPEVPPEARIACSVTASTPIYQRDFGEHCYSRRALSLKGPGDAICAEGLRVVSAGVAAAFFDKSAVGWCLYSTFTYRTANVRGDVAAFGPCIQRFSGSEIATNDEFFLSLDGQRGHASATRWRLAVEATLLEPPHCKGYFLTLVEIEVRQIRKTAPAVSIEVQCGSLGVQSHRIIGERA